MLGQYKIMDFHTVTNIGCLWVLHMQPYRFQGVQFYSFHSQTTILCGIGQIVGGGGMTVRAYIVFIG